MIFIIPVDENNEEKNRKTLDFGDFFSFLSIKMHYYSLASRWLLSLFGLQTRDDNWPKLPAPTTNGPQQPLDGAVQLCVPAAPKPTGLDANQLARAMYPNIARSLQKYLRLTKQTGRHNLQSIYEHLSKCILYKLNARTFLEKFTNLDPIWQQNETNLFSNCRLFNGQEQFQSMTGAKRLDGRHQELEVNSWSLVCDTLLSRQLDSGTFFLLKQGQVSLLVSVARMPHLNLTEQVVDQNSRKFTLGQARAETSSV